MRRITFLSAFLAVAIAHAAQEPTIIPITVVDGNNIADLVVGEITLGAHIDTGGYRSLGVSPAALARIQVRGRAGVDTRTDGGGSKFTGRTFTVPELKLGGQVFRDVPGYERKQSAGGSFGGPAAFDAVIGRDFLGQFAVVVDYPNNRIELHDADNGASVCGAPTARLTFDVDGYWVSSVITDHGPLQLIWDSGARGASFIQDKIAVQRNLPLVDDAYITRKFMLGERDLGPIELVPISLNGIPALDGLIGISVFAKHRICFDLRGESVAVR